MGDFPGDLLIGKSAALDDQLILNPGGPVGAVGHLDRPLLVTQALHGSGQGNDLILDKDIDLVVFHQALFLQTVLRQFLDGGIGQAVSPGLGQDANRAEPQTQQQRQHYRSGNPNFHDDTPSLPGWLDARWRTQLSPRPTLV